MNTVLTLASETAAVFTPDQTQAVTDQVNGVMFGTEGVWFLIGAALVFFMQCGFAMVETGFTRAKNAGNIIMKNLMDFCIGTPIYWLLGFGIMFAGTGALMSPVSSQQGESIPSVCHAVVLEYTG